MGPRIAANESDKPKSQRLRLPCQQAVCQRFGLYVYIYIYIFIYVYMYIGVCRCILRIDTYTYHIYIYIYICDRQPILP